MRKEQLLSFLFYISQDQAFDFVQSDDDNDDDYEDDDDDDSNS